MKPKMTTTTRTKDRRMGKLLDSKNAVIYGAGGAIGGAVARAFAREGAYVFLAGRTKTPLETVEADIVASGGKSQVVPVDALDAKAVERHAAGIAAEVGSIDISFNAIGLGDTQGTPLTEITHDRLRAFADNLRLRSAQKASVLSA
jgi:3-oxoacyl-[acyl-carrier protein] reductase